jgi:hypothetical protein
MSKPSGTINSQTKESKYNFKFRLEKQDDNNEYVNDVIVYLDAKDLTMNRIVKLLNASLSASLRVRMPHKPKFERFEGK